MNADYANDISLLVNTPTQAEFLQQAARGIAFNINANKTEYMCFNKKRDISTINGVSLKLVDKFSYLGSSISSTEK